MVGEIMPRIIRSILVSLSLGSILSNAYAFGWNDLWFNPDQQGAALLKEHPESAARLFNNPRWKGVAYFNSKNYEQATAQFGQDKTSNGFYNQGNALAYQNNYPEAIKAYEEALKLNPHNSDAQHNLDVLKKLMQQQQQQSKNSDKDSKSQQQDKKSSDNNSKDNSDKNQANQNQAQNQQNSNSKSANNSQENQANPADKQNKPDSQTQKGSQNKQSENNPSADQSRRNQETNGNNSHNQQPENMQNNQSAKSQANSSNTPLAKPSQNQQQSAKPMAAKQEQDENRQQQGVVATVGEPNKKLTLEDREVAAALAQIPDDPGGLLRNKFLRDYQNQQAQGGNNGQ